MREGIIAVSNTGFSTVSSTTNKKKINGYTLNECVEASVQSQLNSGRIQTGRAVLQELESVSEIYVQNGKIMQRKTDEKITNFTDFILVPNEFIVVSDTSGKFFYENSLPSRTGSTFSRPNIDIDSYAKSRQNADPWKVGFSNTGSNAQKGTVYGDDVTSDPDMGTVLQNSDKNQLGLEFQYNTKDTKMQISTNGYIQVSQPAINSLEFVEFIRDEIAPHW